MRIRHILVVLPFLALAACSSDNPLAGHWSHEGEVAGMKVGIDFGEADQIMAHLDGPNGHSHPKPISYTFDAATKLVTVKCKLMGDGKADTWTGTLQGESLELTGGDLKLKLKKGGSAH